MESSFGERNCVVDWIKLAAQVSKLVFYAQSTGWLYQGNWQHKQQRCVALCLWLAPLLAAVLVRSCLGLAWDQVEEQWPLGCQTTEPFYCIKKVNHFWGGQLSADKPNDDHIEEQWPVGCQMTNKWCQQLLWRQWCVRRGIGMVKALVTELIGSLKFLLVWWSVTTKTASGLVELSLPIIWWSVTWPLKLPVDQENFALPWSGGPWPLKLPVD